MNQPSYKLIAIDFDGTLLCPKGTITPRVKSAIHQAEADGITICFATGRAFSDCQPILNAAEHAGAAVFVSGAVVMDLRNGSTLRRTFMDPDLSREVCATIESMGVAVLALQEQSPYGVDYLASESMRLEEPTRKWLEYAGSRVKLVPSVGTFDRHHTVRISASLTPDVCAKTHDALVEKFGPRISIHALGPYGTHQLLEIFDSRVNKWYGVQQIARARGISDEQVIAIGDDANDIPMIVNAGLGVAMGNARPDVQQVAQRIIGRNDEDGLADFLEEVLSANASGQPLKTA